MMRPINVTTEEFWDKMGSPKFIRLDLYRGRIANTVYHTSDPPERVEGFLENKIHQTLQHLGVKQWLR